MGMEWRRFALAMVGHFLASLLYVMRKLHIISAVVDTSSILEHREELRELWEKRMMADDNQSSPPSVAVEKTNQPEEGPEEAVVTTKTISESETPTAKLTNGDCNGHVATPQEVESHDQDSLEANQVEEYVEEKMYTSETSFVMKVEGAPTTVEETKAEVTVETKTETIETKVEETVETKVIEVVETKTEEVTEVKAETATVEVKEEEKIENTPQEVVTETPAEEAVVVSAVEKEAVPAAPAEVEVAQPEDKKESEKESEEKVVEVPEVTTKVEETKAAPEPILQIEESKQDGDGFVTLEDCLPKVEDAAETDFAAHESVDPQPSLSNGHVEPAEANSLPPTPEPSDDKANHPEIEEFVKSGGVKRIIPGVQKTEQPYSTCTTETKIAMEIREMREREEELRLMREQAALSPAPSPLPPAHSPAPSIRSPSPSIAKDQATPYRVSSVFGRGTPSPVEERQQPFKVAKETAVEREIRLARDREEELRKQKGLPPREDDSYVKPSQVKSSQVRVFGKAANGANVKQAATAKIQLEIEEQTQREIALRETGSIQTISHERTDAKVAKLKTPEPPATTNGSSHPVSNGHLNGRSSPEKRPSAPRPASIFSQGVSMHKFIASKGAPRPAFSSAPPPAVVPAPKIPEEKTVLKVKRNVESKIQQEIMEMKMREEELKLLHMNANGNHNGDSMEHEMNQKNNLMEYENGHTLNEEDISPRHNKLIAQWEQRIQKAES